MKTKTQFQLFLCSISLLLNFACNQQRSEKHSQGTQGSKPSVLKFVKHTLTDQTGTHLAAATYLVPEGWNAEDEVNWDISNISNPATAKITVTNEETQAALQGFPTMVFIVNTDADLNEEYPAGSKYFGAEVLNQKPTVLDLIKNYVLPSYRDIEGLKIKEEKNLSLKESNHQRAGEYKNTDSKSGVIKIEYTENGKDFEEAIYGTITFLPVSQYQKYAYLTMCYGCKAVKGELADNIGIFETILNSVKLNPKWAVTYNQVMQMAMQNAMRGNGTYGGGNYDGGNNTYGNNQDGNNYQDGMGNGNYNGGMGEGNYSPGNTGNLSDYISSASGRIDNSMIQSYQNQQRSEDRVYEGYSDYMRGYQNFTDPNSGDVYKLSSGYSNAWTDNSGSVVLSNDAGYDPNAGGGGSTWSSLSAGGSTYSSASSAATETTTDAGGN